MLDKPKAILAYTLSFTKHEWNFEDYPVRIRKQKGVENSNHVYSAQIIHWWVVGGLGPNKKAALEELKRNFVSVCSNRKEMPRPGTSVPIEFASTRKTNEIPQYLISDFLEHILGFSKQDQKLVFISDESSLWDFTSERDLHFYYKKISERYEINVSQCEGAKVCEILKLINEK
ncbi:MAG TPA: hypothetical protein VK742_19275 [Candidatus Sulfotelmatobacter sp.]|jgi:hypothetical protein|nr:hypothetical protein [Candidatus Sulfotelmatobacter sp.]